MRSCADVGISCRRVITVQCKRSVVEDWCIASDARKRRPSNESGMPGTHCRCKTMRRVCTGDLCELVNTHLGLSSEPGKHDDPPEHVFTEEIVFHGGSYVVFPGPNADVAETLRWLLKAISLSKTPVGTRNFRDNVIRLAVTCLSISHNIARRANVARGVVADQGKDHDISVPFSKSLSELSSTVQIDQTDLVSCL